jgi:hypothetical protein
MSFVSSSTGLARADDTKIALRISGCEAANIKADRLFELVRTELAPRLLRVGDIGAEARELLADVHLCAGTLNGASITIQRSGLSVAQRMLDLSDVVGDLRARTIAVALAEMVSALPPEPPNSNANSVESEALIPEAKPAIAPTPAANFSANPAPTFSDRVLDSSREQSSRTLRLGAGAAFRQFFGPSTSLLGPWMSISGHRFLLEALFLTSNSQLKTGSVVLYNLDAAAAYEVVAWGRLPKFTARLKGELGVTWAKGKPTNPSSVSGKTESGTQVAALLELLVDNPMSRRLGIEAGLLGGVAAVGLQATADGSKAANTSGVFFGATLGVTFDLSEI